MKASPESLYALGGHHVSRMGSLDLSQGRVDDIKGRHDPRYWDEFDRITRGEYAPPIVVPDELILKLGEWRSFCCRILKVDLDIASLRIPNRVDGIDRLNITPSGVSINSVVKAHLDRKIPFWKWCSSDVESAMQESERGPVKRSQVIWVRDIQEADDEAEKELQNLSAAQIGEQKIDTESLRDRLIHGLKFWDETGGDHLDVKSMTLCTASRDADGGVPRVHRFGDGRVSVCRYGIGYSLPDLRARRAVR